MCSFPVRYSGGTFKNMKIKSKVKISPSLMCADLSSLGKETERLVKEGADLFHFDICDGCFVPILTFGPMIIAALRKKTKIPFEIHLQTMEPEKKIDDFIKSGADIIIVHAESSPHLFRLIKKIKDGGAKAGIALNPATSLSSLEYILSDLDMVLIMTVDTGLLGQPFIPQILRKIKKAKEIIESKKLSVAIEVDGCINKFTIPKVVEAGADILVLGSSAGLFDPDRKKALGIKEIRGLIEVNKG